MREETIAQWQRRAAQAMEARGNLDAIPDADWMLCEALRCGRGQLRLFGERALTPDQSARLEGMLARRLDGEPLQYILGNQPFMGLDFKVDSRVLIPRQDTETLCEAALEALDGMESPEVLDLCTGSGALAVSIKRLCPKARVCASDLSLDALTLARENARALGAAVEFFQGDLFAPLKGRTFDLIVTNPPYIPSGDLSALQKEVQQEPRMALDGGADGLDFYRRIALEAPSHLKTAGLLMAEVGVLQAQAVGALFGAALGGSVRVIRDLCGIERVVCASRG